MALSAGAKVGEYRLVKKLGEGGMGFVWLAVHDVLGQQVVLKGLHEQFLRNKDMRTRFAREAEAMGRLAHPNLIKIFDFKDLPEGNFIVMEYVDGETIEAILQRSGLIPPQRAVELILPALSGIGYAHVQQIIHRDIKPANIMLLRNGEVRVLDFGVAKLADRPGLTRVGMTLGTATYMAPEQHLGTHELKPAADVYAIGVTLYELCTGNLPFECASTAELIRKVYKEPPISPRVYNPELPKKLEDVILKCLAKKPDDRYKDAADLEKALRPVYESMLVDADAAARAHPVPAVAAASGAARVSLGSALAATVIAGAAAVAVGAGIGLAFLSPPHADLGLRIAAGAAGLWFVVTVVLARMLGTLLLAPQAQATPHGSTAAMAVAAPTAPDLRVTPASPTVPLAAAQAAPGATPTGGWAAPGGIAEQARERRNTSTWRHARFDPASPADDPEKPVDAALEK